MMNAVFHEEQRFRQRLPVILIALLAGLSWVAFITQIILKNGKRVLIGSQEPERLATILRDLLRWRR